MEKAGKFSGFFQIEIFLSPNPENFPVFTEFSSFSFVPGWKSLFQALATGNYHQLSVFLIFQCYLLTFTIAFTFTTTSTDKSMCKKSNNEIPNNNTSTSL